MREVPDRLMTAHSVPGGGAAYLLFVGETARFCVRLEVGAIMAHHGQATGGGRTLVCELGPWCAFLDKMIGDMLFHTLPGVSPHAKAMLVLGGTTFARHGASAGFTSGC